MKKRLLATLLALALALTLLPTAALAADDGFVIEDGILKDYNGTDWYVTIPDGVTSIGERAFRRHKSLISVTIPGSVTSIGSRAFEDCVGLTSVTIENGVTDIGVRAFTFCTSLTSVTIPGSVTRIGEGAFQRCDSLTSATIGAGVTHIGEEAFAGCALMTSVTIPDSVTSIGAGAFRGCSLTSVTIPDSVTNMGGGIFDQCRTLTSVIIGNGVTSIEASAFRDCDSLTSVTIGANVTSIGETAFEDCTGLTHVTIPDSVTRIGRYAFMGCTGLTDVTIGNGVTGIGSWAFAGCTGLTSVTIPDGVTSIESGAFLDCDNLTSVTIPDSVTSGDDFYGCTALTDIYYSGNESQWRKTFGMWGLEEDDTVTVHFAQDAPLMKSMFTVYTNREEYTGKPITKEISGWDNYGLTENTDYTVSYQNNVEPGTAQIIITGIGGYTGTLTYEFSIGEKPVLGQEDPKSEKPPEVTPRLDGGSWSGAFVLNSDGTLRKPVDPTRPGYIFAGWYLDDGTVWDFSRKVADDLTLNARWLPAVKIILRLDTGDVNMNTAQGQPMNVPANPTKEGYTFGGWYTDAALTIPWNFNTAVTGDMELYGKWTPLTSTAASTGRSSQAITFNGAPIQLEAYTLAADSNGGDVTFVKLRDVAAVLDGSEAQFNVEWKNGAIYVARKTAYTTKNGTELQPIVVNTTGYEQNVNPVLFDGEIKSLESIIITDVDGGGHTFFKLRDLAAAVGFTVDWTAERGIYIETK